MYRSLEEICKEAAATGCSFWELIQKDDCRERQIAQEESFVQLQRMYQAMKEADQDYDETLHSRSGLVGTDGGKLEHYVDQNEPICGDFLGRVMEKAVKMGESNACMKRIVAAPTAGACGVIPAVFLSYEEYCKETENRMVEALFVSAGIGAVIAENASIAGASGGCQAEIGSASAMAAGGLAYLQGGDAECIANAAAFALKNMLGLTCDPVCGLVEVPCIKRNSAGAVNAAVSAQMAMAGIKSAIPADEVVDSMRRIGNALPAALRETSEGGLAVTESARKIAERMGKKEHIAKKTREGNENQ